jgi:hypothetical protein
MCTDARDAGAGASAEASAMKKLAVEVLLLPYAATAPASTRATYALIGRSCNRISAFAHEGSASSECRGVPLRLSNA